MNKADSMDPAELLKVNSALTWALSRILRSPEPRRIYTGSFWDQPLKPTYLSELFEKESASLLADLHTVPRNNTVAKVNDLVMRARMVKVQLWRNCYSHRAIPVHTAQFPFTGAGAHLRRAEEGDAEARRQGQETARAHRRPRGGAQFDATLRHSAQFGAIL